MMYGAGTTIRTVPLAASVSLSPGTATAIFCAALTVAAAAGALATSPGQTAHALTIEGREWANLLRGMAALKTLMAATAAAAVLWRIRAPVSIARLAAYTASAAAMFAGPGLIWGLCHIPLGAVLLHAGLAATLLLLWRDPQVEQQLSALVDLKRRR